MKLFNQIFVIVILVSAISVYMVALNQTDINKKMDAKLTAIALAVCAVGMQTVKED